MIDAPDVTPVAIPEEEPIDVLVLLLLQLPPPASDSVVALPTQRFVVPEIDTGKGFTVIDVVAMQPVARV
jgi:hypothetical protein